MSACTQVSPSPLGQFSTRLMELRLLRRDWNGYGADPPNDWALGMAQQVIRLLLEQKLVPTKVAPAGKGGVEICFTRGNRFADFQCSNSSRLFVMTSDPDGRPEMGVSEIYPDNLYVGISKIKAFIER